MVEGINLASKIFLFLGILLSLVRFLKGPTPLDRILSLDVIAMAGLGLLGFLMIETNDENLLDVILIWVTLPFVGTAAVCGLLWRYELK